MASQTVLPAQWIIVDDGSTDSTGDIIDAAAKKHAWIKTVHRANRGFRKNGGGVIEAFYDGYTVLTSKDFDFIIKLDGDLSFKPDYFERCFEKFGKNQRLGIGGGIITSVFESQTIVEGSPRFHVRGATKIYRKACWNDIDHLIKAPGWDTLDEVKANMKGWSTESFQDLGLVQHKMTGSADGSWNNWVKNGLANYISGYHPLFMLFKCIKRLPNKPRVIAAVGLMWGFCLGYIKRTPQVNEPDLIAYLRKEQIKKLLLKKSIWQ
jgi:glycosyltransferase involved in cell wall biosynthesis